MTRFLRRPRRLLQNLNGSPLAVAALGCVLLASPVQAQTDPVDTLRDALVITTGAAALNPTALAYRQKALEAASKELRTINDLLRALNLAGWRDSDPRESPDLAAVDRAARAGIAERLTRNIRVAVRQPNATSRLSAATFVGEMGANVRSVEPRDRHGLAASFTPELVQLTTDNSPAVQQAAARALGKIDPRLDQAIPALRHMLEKDGVSERRAAASALGDLVKVVGELASTGQTQRGVRATEADQIATLSAVVPAAAVGARDPADPHVRRLSMEAIRGAAQQLEKMVPEPEEPGFPRYLFTGGKHKLTPGELRKIQEATSDLRARKVLLAPLLNVLGKQGQLLRARLDDQETSVRFLSRKALEFIASSEQKLRRYERSIPVIDLPPEGGGPPGAGAGPVGLQPERLPEPTKEMDPLLNAILPSLDVIARGLRDPSTQVRLASVEFLELLGFRALPAQEALVGVLCDRDAFVRWGAARALAHLVPVRPDLVVPALARELKDTDLDARQAAIYTLKLYGTRAQAAVPALVEATQEGDTEPRIAAIQALTVVLGPLAQGEGAVSAVDALMKSLKSSDVRLRQAAAEGLGRIGPVAIRAVPALQAAINDPSNDVRRVASEALLTIQLQASGKGP
jgi:HEAT repeat protein